MRNIWSQETRQLDSAKTITAKFKRLRQGIKIWARNKSQIALYIKNTNDLISLFDMLEEFRELSTWEHNGRQSAKKHMFQLLKNQNAYWKQRATIRWAKFGEVNSKFFHTKATIKYRRNFIASIQDEYGNDQSDHKIKAAILERAFKQRLGNIAPCHDDFQLLSLINPMNNLLDLETPFTKEEIDNVIKELPSDKTPGPDGFNTNFIKACWPIIAKDF